MAIPGAPLLEITRRGLFEVDLRETAYFRLLAAFKRNPDGFLTDVLRTGEDADALP
jgi:predicted ATPase